MGFMCLELMNVKFGVEVGYLGFYRFGVVRDFWNWVLSYSFEIFIYRSGCLVFVCEVGLGGIGIVFSFVL